LSQQPTRRYSGQSADERDAARRERLLAAATDFIGRQGYAATTVERICAEAKVSTRHFYQQFDNKESVFLAVYDDITGRSYQRATASLEATRGKTMPERIPAAFLAYLGPMVEDIRAARIAFVEIVGASPRIEEVRLAYREGLIELISAEGTAAVERGEVRDRDWRFAALALTGATNAIVYDWTLHSGKEPVEQLEASLVELAGLLLAG
jgi:AcrR family transcriptional regulator